METNEKEIETKTNFSSDAFNTNNLDSYIDFDLDNYELDDIGDLIIEEKSDVKWTKEQQQAISDRNRNLLVSASAGSGKTAVMTQRIVDLVCKDRVPISNFLIVTFTNASAQDMKLKILKRLQNMPQDEYVLEQIDMIPTSDISDLHSFYSRLVSTYFYEVVVDPSYHIIDAVQSNFYKEKAISRLFEKKEKEDDEEFFNLFDIMQRKRHDTAFKEIIFEFSEYLDSHIDGDKWFNETIESAYDENIETNVCVKLILNVIEDRILYLSSKFQKFADLSMSYGCDKYHNYYSELASNIKAISSNKSFMANSKLIKEFKLGRRPTPKQEHRFLCDESEQLNKEANKLLEDLQKIFVYEELDDYVIGMRQAKDNLKSLYSLTKEYSKIYDGLKREVNGLDFNDLEKYALKILSNPAICETVKNKYKYIFVDEYQDVNGVQEKIISMISSVNNRFMVGDLKQSIYGFRLCDPDIFLEKYKSYSSDSDLCSVIRLNCNFRSDKKILKFVDKVFSGVMREKFGGIDYETESKFTAGDNNLDLPESTHLCFIDSTKDDSKEFVSGDVYSVKNHVQVEDEEIDKIVAEAKFVSQKIAEILEEDKNNNIETDYSDFAVLVFARNSNNIEIFIEKLKSMGIPVSSDEKINLMKMKYIQEILNFIKVVINSKDDFLIFKVLKSRLFNFTDEEIVEIRKISKKIKFYEFTHCVNNIENECLKQKVALFLETIKRYKKLSGLMTIKDFVKLIVKDFKLERLNMLNNDGVTQNENTQKFISTLPDIGVNEFLVNYKNFALEIQNEGSGDAVNILTVHKSKGIEYKYVFLINTSRELNFDSAEGKILFNKNFGVGFKNYNTKLRIEEPTIPYLAIQFYEKQKVAEEQQRVLYVALTRAIKKMFVVCSAKLNSIKNDFPLIPHTYLDWFKPIIYNELNGNGDENIVFENYTLDDFSDDAEIEENQLLLKRENAEKVKEFEYRYKNSVNISLKNSVSKILKNRKNSIQNKETNKETLIDVDTIEYENYIDEMKFGENLDNIKNNYIDNIIKSSAERGTAYHKILQNIDFNDMENIEKQIEQLSLKYPNEFSLINRDIVENILKLPIFSNLTNFTILKEREFIAEISAKIVDEKAYESDKIILQGVIDLCAISEDEIYVLDYKTGKISDEKLEDYKFQIETYSNVIERVYNKKVTKKLICFIDEEKVIEF